MKILLVTAEHPGNAYGGMSTFIRHQAEGLKKRGHVIHVIFINFLWADCSEAQKNFHVDSILKPFHSYHTTTHEGKVLDSSSSLVWQCSEVVRSFKPDVIHCNDRQTYLPFRYCSNVVFSLHLLISDMIGTQALDSAWFEEFKIEKMALEKAKAFVVYSKFMAQRVVKALKSDAVQYYIPLGIEIDKYYKRKNPEKIVISYFGRLEDIQKGFFEYLRAVELLKDEKLQINIEFNIFGKGDFPENFSKEHYERVEFLQGEELVSAYAITDIVVMPSRYEPFGYVGLEALASSCLLLTPTGLGMDEYISPGSNFIEIQADYEDIYCKLLKIISDFENYQSLIDNAKNSVKEWTIERSIEAHESLYHLILTEKYEETRRFSNATAWNQLFAITSSEKNETKDKIFSLIQETCANGVNLFAGIEFKNYINYSSECPHQQIVVRYPGKHGSDCLFGRLEHLPYTNQFQRGFYWGAFEYALNPGKIFEEIDRCILSELCVIVTIGRHYHRQSLSADSLSDWENLIKDNLRGWKIVSKLELEEYRPFVIINCKRYV